MNKFIKLFVAASALTVVSANVMAADAYDFTSIASSVDFAGVGVGVIAVAAVVASIYAMIRGVKLVLSVIKS